MVAQPSMHGGPFSFARYGIQPARGTHGERSHPFYLSQVDNEEREGNARVMVEMEVVSMSDHITIDNAVQIRRRLSDALRSQPVLVTVDFSDVTHMDTSGLATLMEADRTAHQQGTRLVLSGIQEQPRYLLKINHLDHVFEIEEGASS